MSKKKLIPITEDAMVRLTVSPVRWSMLPNSCKKVLLEGARTVAEIRSICDSAVVHWMTPVEILDEIWMCSVNTISGRATAITVGKVGYMGVQLPAQTAVHQNSEDLRAILVHEFAHCFYYYEQCVLRWDAGERTLRSLIDNLYENEDADRAHLPDLSDWFDQLDVRNFAFWNDTQLTAIDQNIRRLVERFKVVEPETRFASNVTVVTEVAEHVRKLRRLRAKALAAHKEGTGREFLKSSDT